MNNENIFRINKRDGIKEHMRITPIINKYLKGKQIPHIFKSKYILFAGGGGRMNIDLFSTSLEYMGSLYGHSGTVRCIATLSISPTILASASLDNSIKIWELGRKFTVCTLVQHTKGVTAISYVHNQVIASGSGDSSIIIWQLATNTSTLSYVSKYVLTGHRSTIQGIIPLNNHEIVSAELEGDLKFWDIDQGTCIRHIPRPANYTHLIQIKHFRGCNAANINSVVICTIDNINIWEASNNWELPIKIFGKFVDMIFSIELISNNILVRGSWEGNLKFVDYLETRAPSPRKSIMQLHTKTIYEILRIAQDIVITASADGSIKVLDPIYRSCYLNFQNGTRDFIYALTKFY